MMQLSSFFFFFLFSVIVFFLTCCFSNCQPTREIHGWEKKRKEILLPARSGFTYFLRAHGGRGMESWVSEALKKRKKYWNETSYNNWLRKFTVVQCTPDSTFIYFFRFRFLSSQSIYDSDSFTDSFNRFSIPVDSSMESISESESKNRNWNREYTDVVTRPEFINKIEKTHPSRTRFFGWLGRPNFQKYIRA